jgi:hypothetical protein
VSHLHAGSAFVVKRDYGVAALQKRLQQIQKMVQQTQKELRCPMSGCLICGVPDSTLL